MTKSQVEPQAAVKWFDSQVLNILWCHFKFYKSIDYKKLPLICFLQYGQKGRVELALFSIEKAHVTTASFLMYSNRQQL